MKNNQPFVRKIVYYCLIAVLLVPLSYISRPATTRKEGGILSQMRQENRLSMSSLGEVDPAGASMSLATLGMRGVATNQLWMYAIRCKKKENYDGLKAATNQITKLQPNFLSVWRFQAHNLSYNISVEFDDYRHRYHWVKKGIDYLVEGTRYNRDEPLLMTELGWFCGHKFGRADEHVQYRRLFREDEDFHRFFEDEAGLDMTETLGPDQRPDTWLLSHLWYRRARQTVESKNVPIQGHSPLVFYSYAPKSLIDFADAIEQEGYLDEKGQEAWRVAAKAWDAFGDRPIPTTRNFDVRLNGLAQALAMEQTAWDKLEELAPGLRRELEDRKRAELSAEERAALDKAPDARTPDEMTLALAASRKIRVDQSEFADEAPTDVRRAVREWVDRAAREEMVASYTESYREIVNYAYWKMRCEAEQEDLMITARRHVLDAERLYDESALVQAQEEYDAAWKVWAEVYDKYPLLRDDVESEILLESIARYQGLLGQLEQPFPPPNFPLLDFVSNRRAEYNELVDEQFGVPATTPPTPE